ncbi:amino acid permease/ SLC12A domain-containing protein [Pseudomassariella vexata]|uniref:Amino acid permease/ SLC12A domain-containing protein n=1 Tax=Pseudomassariella vexata TaxID=1141098 RepID=A0A1Y2EHY9_9PEZI|nr:amino acid permease/ SLC12A domain-containing protein [Pseudomassariella vexata]ORY71057.1 amino acid permease/ SLC12A domain-containing protein [Pseudomassariella vexata]
MTTNKSSDPEAQAPEIASSQPDNHHVDISSKHTPARRNNIGHLNRKLKSRHVQFLALSGAIGTGLFVGCGQILSLAGPLSAFLAYLFTGLNLYAVINSLGEMATYLPLPGAVPVYAARYVDEALGFTLGWNYWYQLAIGVPIEVTVAALIINYWPQSAVPDVVWVTILFLAMVIVNCFPVRIYGEAEFIFGAIKITTIVGLIVLMFVITLGGTPSGDRIGFRYWHDPGPMNEYLATGALGRFLAFWKVFIQATFAYGGSEMVVIASGETENPRRSIPKAIRRVFWRIAIFYILAIFLVGLCVSSKDGRLLDAIASSAPGVAASPFVIAVENGGIAVLPAIINAVVLTSAWSAGNSFFYASTRVLYAAALDGKAPRFLTYERWGIPYACVAATTLLSCLVYLNVNNQGAEVFFWFSNLSAVSTLIVWASICITYLRFYYGLRHNGIARESLPFRSPRQPYLAWFAICFCLVVAFFNGFDAFFPSKFSAKSFIPPYIDIPIFVGLFLGYKLVKGTKFVKLCDMDLWSGKAEIDSFEGTWPEVRPRNFLERIWFWIA